MFACGGVTVMGKHWPAASNNGCGDVALEKEMGVYVLESLTQDLNSSSDSDDEESHVSTESGSIISKSEYESTVNNFGALENQLLNAADSLQQESLYKSVFEAEVAFALKFKIYSHLITGNQQEVSIAKEKTRNRMRTRFKNKCCISVPVQGRAMRGEKTKKKVRFRIDPETHQIVSWLSFRQRHTTIMPDDIVGLWKKLPRVTRPSKARLWEGEAMTWSQCMDRYGEIYDMSSLLIWYKRLPRAENLGRKGAYQ